MKIIVNDSGIKLIKKYERYYLRFMGGQHEEYPCDLLITNREAASVITDNTTMKVIMDKYKKEIPWTLSYFVEEAIKDYVMKNIKILFFFTVQHSLGYAYYSWV